MGILLYYIGRILKNFSFLLKMPLIYVHYNNKMFFDGSIVFKSLHFPPRCSIIKFNLFLEIKTLTSLKTGKADKKCSIL